MFQLQLVTEAKQLWVVELGEDCEGAKEAASSMGDGDVQGMFADARAVTVRFKQKKKQTPKPLEFSGSSI